MHGFLFQYTFSHCIYRLFYLSIYLAIDTFVCISVCVLCDNQYYLLLFAYVLFVCLRIGVNVCASVRVFRCVSMSVYLFAYFPERPNRQTLLLSTLGGDQPCVENL